MKAKLAKNSTITVIVVTVMWITTIPLEALRVIAFLITTRSFGWCAFGSALYWFIGVVLLLSSFSLLVYCYVNNVDMQSLDEEVEEY